MAIAVDSANDVLYLAQGGQRKIDKVKASTGAFIGSIGGTTASSGTCPASGVTPGWCTGGTFTSGTTDGMYSQMGGLAFDPVNDALYIADTGNQRIVKVTASTGAFVGAIGKTTASTGTCPASGIASTWCTGGTFTSASQDGAYNDPYMVTVDPILHTIYVDDYNNDRIVKLVAKTGSFMGAIGNATASTGTCPASGPASKWCTGGTFTYGSGDGMFGTSPGAPMRFAVSLTANQLYISDTNNNRIVKTSK